jgi:hypothetical protein
MLIPAYILPSCLDLSVVKSNILPLLVPYLSAACWFATPHIFAPCIVVKLVQRAFPPPLSSLREMPDGLNYFQIIHVLPSVWAFI